MGIWQGIYILLEIYGFIIPSLNLLLSLLLPSLPLPLLPLPLLPLFVLLPQSFLSLILSLHWTVSLCLSITILRKKKRVMMMMKKKKERREEEEIMIEVKQ